MAAKKPSQPIRDPYKALCTLEELLYFVQGDPGFERRTRQLARDVRKQLKPLSPEGMEKDDAKTADQKG